MRPRGQELPEIRVRPPGRRSVELAARLGRVEAPAFDARRAARAEKSGEDQTPIVYASGFGSNVEDVDGNRYVDLTAGFGAAILGHRPPVVAEAMVKQGEELWLALGDVYGSEAKLQLCEQLGAFYPGGDARVLLGTSGADAVTAALKTAVLATGKPGVIAFEGAYHGLSYAPLAACGLEARFREPFAPQLNTHVVFAPYPRAEAVLDASMRVVREALQGGECGAVIVEPILGRGGCIVPPTEFLPELRRECDKAGALLICDEIWTGLGRSGAWLASLEVTVPDVLCLGKGLGAGLPISACVGSDRVMQAWGAHGGSTIHTATHFGAPLACAAALATMATLRGEGLPERAKRAGARWMQELRRRTQGRGVLAVQGRGLMVGIALDGGAGRALAVSRRLLGLGYIVLTGGIAGDVLTLTPALDIDDALLDAFTAALPGAL